MKNVFLTEAGREKLTEELKQLHEVAHPEAVARLKEAREYGDLSENSEYDAARLELERVVSRISEIEATLEQAKTIKKTGSTTVVSIGSKVTVEIEGDTEEYTIVGTAESDPLEGLISSESPLGKALIGANVGEVVKFTPPSGAVVSYTVKAVS